MNHLSSIQDGRHPDRPEHHFAAKEVRPVTLARSGLVHKTGVAAEIERLRPVIGE
jgi:hypothetical protein